MTYGNELATPEIITTRADSTLNNQTYVYGNVHSKGGLTKREYFAAMALQTLIGSDGKYADMEHCEIDAPIICEQAVLFSDKLIEALNK